MQRQIPTTERLIIFVKAPRPGLVKTRLASAIGPEAACDAYRLLVDRLTSQLGLLTNVQLRFSPDEACDEITPWLKQNWSAAPQGNGPLGDRLTRAFAEAFAEGLNRVAIIGSDCPAVTEQDVVEAWSALETQDVVLGPASDGGYWLIGLNGPCEGIFEQIDWSTSHVLRQTLQGIRANGKSYHLLRELADIDTLDDWNAYFQPNAALRRSIAK